MSEWFERNYEGFSINIEGYEIYIFRLVNCGNVSWKMECRQLDLYDRGLNTQDIETAKKNALLQIQSIVSDKAIDLITLKVALNDKISQNKEEFACTE